jgi:mono/diheme cytochrome c family protein
MRVRHQLLPVFGAAALAAAAAVVPLAEAPDAQVVVTGPIQSPGGGRGAGAAPDAKDPANANADLSPKPPVVPQTPEEQAKQFWLPAGYRMTAVLSDPLIEDPAQITFDGNGRMYVVELRGYFQRPDGVDLVPPIGRISRHEDRNGDGVFEHHTVFVDHLVFPRFATPFGADAVLTMETNADEVWKHTDVNGDGVADRKEIFTTGFGRASTMESQPSSLFWAMDNWLYSTVNAFRLRWTPTGLLKEPTGPNGAQWGVTQDNFGKVHFQHGASGLPGYFQFPVHYGSFAWPDQFEPNLNIVWGAPILIGDIQAGVPGTRIPDGSLIYGTAAAGNEIFRGHRLPADLVGDYVHGDAVGRLVRRLRPVKLDGLTQLRNVYPRSEFIRSLDPLFRPVEMATAPDGTMYIADMYRGIIEGAEWAKEGTYLREKIKQYQLDKAMKRGRVWRLTYDGMEPDRTQPRMLQETPAQLVRHLSHANGWWRDTAQQLIVLKQDRSVAPALQTIVRTSKHPLARYHALWTLEGLSALEAPLVRTLLKDADQGMRIQAMRASESLYKAGDRSFASEYAALAKDPDTDVATHALLTMNLFKLPEAAAAAHASAAGGRSAGLRFVADRIANPPAAAGRGGGRGGPALTAEHASSLERGATIYNELCFSCHGDDGRGTPTPGGGGGATLAPSLAGSDRVNGHRDYVVKAILHGLTGPIDGRTYPQVMPASGANRDEWVADVASFVRMSFGNASGMVTTGDVARVRAMTSTRTTPWTYPELAASVPTPLAPEASWTVTASHTATARSSVYMETAPAGALNYLGWTTEVPQQPGMWLQVELPQAVRLTELQFVSPTIGGGRAGPAQSTHPVGYRVEVSTDGTGWGTPVAEGAGAPGTMTITFAPVTAKFVRITQTAGAPGAPPWSMRLLRLYRAP